MPPDAVSPRLVRMVAHRASGRCEYCQSPAAFTCHPFHVDHIIPRALGGATVMGNLAYACGCNAYKGDRISARDPKTGRTVPLFHPRRQSWKRHFEWSSDATAIVGRTAAGRATVALLRMNRPSLVILRRLLVLAGIHPPTAG